MKTKHAGITVKVNPSISVRKVDGEIISILSAHIVDNVITKSHVRKKSIFFSGFLFIRAMDIITPIIHIVKSSNGK